MIIVLVEKGRQFGDQAVEEGMQQVHSKRHDALPNTYPRQNTGHAQKSTEMMMMKSNEPSLF